MKIAIGNDHAGYEIKLVVMEWLREHDLKCIDYAYSFCL